MRRLTPALPAFLVITAAGVSFLPQSAGAEDGILNVSAEVVAQCSVVDATELAFGEYDPTDTVDTSAEAEFSVTCTTNANVEISLDQGSSAEGLQRQLTDGFDNFLPYDLYQDASHDTAFVVGEVTQISVSPTVSTPVFVYGVIPAGELVQTGNYNDSVVISLDF